MKLLLDTHVLIWVVSAPTQLSVRVRDMVVDESNAVFVSAASAWEIATKVRLKKMEFDATFLDDFDRRVAALGLEPLGIEAQHAVAGARLEGPHRDPFDRLLAGQAAVEGLTLVTRDAQLATLGVATIW